ncbi:hypothetical protein BGZ83_003375, partial [Gryganskiella cystojenkinii]
LAFLKNRTPNTLLVPQYDTGPDGVWFFSDEYAGALAIKFYSGPIPSSVNKSNEASSDVRLSFSDADGVCRNSKLYEIRDEFDQDLRGKKIKGILRIQVTFPSVLGEELKTCVHKNPTTGFEDVMVYINTSSMDDFFREAFDDNYDDMKQLKNLINYVGGQREYFFPVGAAMSSKPVSDAATPNVK